MNSVPAICAEGVPLVTVPEVVHRVVLVDDVDGLRVLVRLALESTGRFQVVAEGGDGEEAITLTKEHRPDLVLLDLSMPKMDGLEALPFLRSVSPQTKVVVFTGYETERIVDVARERGACACLQKGLAPDELVGVLTELLEA